MTQPTTIESAAPSATVSAHEVAEIVKNNNESVAVVDVRDQQARKHVAFHPLEQRRSTLLPGLSFLVFHLTSKTMLCYCRAGIRIRAHQRSLEPGQHSLWQCRSCGQAH